MSNRTKPEGSARKVRPGVYEYRGFTLERAERVFSGRFRSGVQTRWLAMTKDPREVVADRPSKRQAMLAVDEWHDTI